MPIVVGLAGPARRVAGARSAATRRCPPPSRRGTRWAARRRATSPAHTSRSYASGKSSSQTQSRDKSNQKVHLNKSHNPSPPPYRVIPVTRVPRRSWPPARWPRATAYAKHPTPRHRLRAKSYLREGGRGGVRGCPVGRSGYGVRPPHHRTLCIAPCASHPGPCPGSATPSPCRHGPGVMARALWPWRDRRRLTARLASLCGLGRARFAPQRRHTRSQAPDTHQAKRPRSWRLPSRCTLLRARALRRCRAAAPRAQRQARKGVACAQPVNAVADREGADHHVVRDEGNDSLEAVPTSPSRVAPAPCHEARQEQQQRRQPAGAARAVRVHERRPPERDSETPQLGGAGRGDQVACRCCQVAAVARLPLLPARLTPHGRTAADCVPSCRGARAKHWQPQRRPHAHVHAHAHVCVAGGVNSSSLDNPRQHSALARARCTTFKLSGDQGKPGKG
jgi:hypothetical protein